MPYCFNLHFKDLLLKWTSVHMFLSHLGFHFCDMFANVLYLFQSKYFLFFLLLFCGSLYIPDTYSVFMIDIANVCTVCALCCHLLMVRIDVLSVLFVFVCLNKSTFSFFGLNLFILFNTSFSKPICKNYLWHFFFFWKIIECCLSHLGL